jgi:hypothetical protein
MSLSEEMTSSRSRRIVMTTRRQPDRVSPSLQSIERLNPGKPPVGRAPGGSSPCIRRGRSFAGSSRWQATARARVPRTGMLRRSHACRYIACRRRGKARRRRAGPSCIRAEWFRRARCTAASRPPSAPLRRSLEVARRAAKGRSRASLTRSVLFPAAGLQLATVRPATLSAVTARAATLPRTTLGALAVGLRRRCPVPLPEPSAGKRRRWREVTLPSRADASLQCTLVWPVVSNLEELGLRCPHGKLDSIEANPGAARPDCRTHHRLRS